MPMKGILSSTGSSIMNDKLGCRPFRVVRNSSSISIWHSCKSIIHVSSVQMRHQKTRKDIKNLYGPNGPPYITKDQKKKLSENGINSENACNTIIHVQYSHIMRFMVLHNRHHKVSQSVPFFMHGKTVTIL